MQVIPKTRNSGEYDPLLRKTFTFMETNWHTEMNRNWEETVYQVNGFSDRITTVEEELTARALQIDDIITPDITALQDAVLTLVTSAQLAAGRAVNAIATLAETAAVGATSLVTGLTQFNIYTDDQIVIYDPATLTRVLTTVTADVPAGSQAIPVEAIADEMTEGSVVMLASGWMREALTGANILLAAVQDSVSDLDDRITSNETAILLNSTQIQLVANSVTTVGGDLTQLETTLTGLIQVNADGLLLRATKAEFDALEDRVAVNEAWIEVNNDQINIAVVGVNTISGNLADALALIEIHEDSIGSLVTQFETLQGTVVANSSSISQLAGSISVNVQDIEDVQDSITSQNANIQVLSDSISLTVTKAMWEAALAGPAFITLASDQTDASATSIAVEALTERLYHNTPILVIDKVTGTNFPFTVNHPADPGYVDIGEESIPVLAAPIDAVAGSAVYISQDYVMGQIRNTGDAITLAISDFESGILTSLTVALDGITAEAKLFASGTFLSTGGSVGVSGELIYDTDTEGWALSANGDFFARNAVLVGSVTTLSDVNDNVVTLDSSGLLMPCADNNLATGSGYLKWFHADGLTKFYFGAYRNADGAVHVGLSSYPNPDVLEGGVYEDMHVVYSNLHFRLASGMTMHFEAGSAADRIWVSANGIYSTDGNSLKVEGILFKDWYDTIEDADAGVLGVNFLNPLTHLQGDHPLDVRYWAKEPDGQGGVKTPIYEDDVAASYYSKTASDAKYAQIVSTVGFQSVTGDTTITPTNRIKIQAGDYDYYILAELAPQ